MKTKDLYTEALRKYQHKAEKTSKSVLINLILKEYYRSTLEEAYEAPNIFGDDAGLAKEDPKGIASQYTALYRKTLVDKDRGVLEYLYASLLYENDLVPEL